jgi:hypothetical protein
VTIQRFRLSASMIGTLELRTKNTVPRSDYGQNLIKMNYWIAKEIGPNIICRRDYDTSLRNTRSGHLIIIP